MTHAHDPGTTLHIREREAPTIKRIEVMCVRFMRGEGCCSDSPVRVVTQYVSVDGDVLFERDPYPFDDHS